MLHDLKYRKNVSPKKNWARNEMSISDDNKERMYPAQIDLWADRHNESEWQTRNWKRNEHHSRPFWLPRTFVQWPRSDCLCPCTSLPLSNASWYWTRFWNAPTVISARYYTQPLHWLNCPIQPNDSEMEDVFCIDVHWARKFRSDLNKPHVNEPTMSPEYLFPSERSSNLYRSI